MVSERKTGILANAEGWRRVGQVGRVGGAGQRNPNVLAAGTALQLGGVVEVSPTGQRRIELVAVGIDLIDWDRFDPSLAIPGRAPKIEVTSFGLAWQWPVGGEIEFQSARHGPARLRRGRGPAPLPLYAADQPRPVETIIGFSCFKEPKGLGWDQA